jgi:hypothetical protein
MRCRAAVFSILLLPYIFAPLDANAYREDESEAQVEADIDRGENKLIEKLVEIEQDLAQNTKKALKAEERRDVELFRRELSRNESVSTDDDSIAEISREVDTLTRTSDR